MRKEVSLSAYFNLEKTRKSNLIDQDLEDEEGVWVLISSEYGVMCWPGKFNKMMNNATLLCEDCLGQYTILSVFNLHHADPDVIVNIIPETFKDEWKKAYVVALNNSKVNLIMNHIFGKEPETTVNQIHAENSKFSPYLNSTTSSFLAKGLISLKGSAFYFENNEEMYLLEKNIAEVVAKDKIENELGLIQYSEEIFDGLNKKEAKKILSPLFALRNLHFTQTSEMNYQEALSIIFSYLVATANGQVTSSGNVRENALSKQARLSRYFTTKYFRPDKILIKPNLFNDLEEENQFDWRFFFGEWSPFEIESIYDHPDFKKVVLLMRASLKELLFELFVRKLLGPHTELEIFGSLSSGSKICFLRLIMTPKISNNVSYSYTFRLYHSKWFNFTTPEGISKIMSIVLQIGKRTLELNFQPQKEGDYIETIHDTPTSSKSVTNPGLYEITCGNIERGDDMVSHEHILKFSSYHNALNMFSTLLNCKLIKNDPVVKYTIQSYRAGVKKETYRTRLYLSKDFKDVGCPLYVVQRGSNCEYPTNEIEILFMLKSGKRIQGHILKVSISTIELLNSVLRDGTNDEDDEGDDDDDDYDNNEDYNSDDKNSLEKMTQDPEIYQSLGSEYKIESETSKAIIGTMNFNNKESFFKITKTEFENVHVMELVKGFSSPNISEIYHYGPFKDKFHITIQEKLLNYETLMEKLLSGSSITGNQQVIIRNIILKSLLGCLRALDYINGHNIVHCDISVHNIMFRMKNEEDFEAVLIDFNNSKLLDSQESSIVNYKEEYSPIDPELRFTIVHDIYALSVVIKKLLMSYSKISGETLSDIQFVEFDVLPLAPLIKKMSSFEYTNVKQVLKDLEISVSI